MSISLMMCVLADVGKLKHFQTATFQPSHSHPLNVLSITIIQITIC